LASELDWELTLRPMRMVPIAQHGQLEALERPLEQLERKLGSDSSNSDKPPSGDSPLKKGGMGESRGKPGANNGQKGRLQVMQEPSNGRAERALRFGVLWRTGSQPTASEKGVAGCRRSFLSSR